LRSGSALLLALEQDEVVKATRKRVEKVDREVAIHLEGHTRVGAGKAGQDVGQMHGREILGRAEPNRALDARLHDARPGLVT
jgi:hypothetical protein